LETVLVASFYSYFTYSFRVFDLAYIDINSYNVAYDIDSQFFLEASFCCFDVIAVFGKALK
jgi:hypothetical protein